MGQENRVKISVCAFRCLFSCLFFGAPAWKVSLGYATSMFVAYTFKSGKRANEFRSLIPRFALPMQFKHFIEYLLISRKRPSLSGVGRGCIGDGGRRTAVRLVWSQHRLNVGQVERNAECLPLIFTFIQGAEIASLPILLQPNASFGPPKFFRNRRVRKFMLRRVSLAGRRFEGITFSASTHEPCVSPFRDRNGRVSRTIMGTNQVIGRVCGQPMSFRRRFIRTVDYHALPPPLHPSRNFGLHQQDCMVPDCAITCCTATTPPVGGGVIASVRSCRLGVGLMCLPLKSESSADIHLHPRHLGAILGAFQR